ncbi:MAG: iron-containing alcohol dehydrogenase family protein [Peptococcaceae bacterium]|nr:iron-containing alcohol dehydrogenase family protein [Peptococcaceae bacterium]
MSYSVALPQYTIGPDCYEQIPYFARYYGKKAVVIGGKTAMAKAKDALLEGIKGSDLEITDFIWYGGNSTYANGDALKANPTVQNADIIFGVGGGRACDTTKYVADQLDKPFFLFPTVASNCASVTAIGVMYNEDGSVDYYYPKLVEHTFINTKIIAESPEEMLWAGIGDALSKECEAVFSSRGADLSHTPLMGVQLSKICTEPLLTYGKEALESSKANKDTKALEQVILDIIISTGIVSNMVTHMPEYYYNSSLAHCVYYGAAVTKKGADHRHGVIVSLGVLCLLTYDKQTALRDRIMRFNYELGLPVCFDDLGIDESEFEAMAHKSMDGAEWKFRDQSITTEKFIACMKEQNAVGRAFKEKMAAAEANA